MNIISSNDKEDIWVFQYKIEFYFNESTSSAVFSRVMVATSENTRFGVHGRNKIQFYTEKKILFFFSYFYL